ncbi:DUF1871 family protein [Psychrobacillus sp. FSL K6-2684]|uniref:DUF1871 family protein n=1 Tax=Psychrobacillus faecigallinarum TaxID=2762235 RepID=A0ABR8RD33_9BACI|nr:MULTISPECIES: DUF1871 family protein [Psychrobacillus]MBD7945705.1 DUF1871 family protein [Psychrobacillus faecigallinarum]QEY22565.1 DUF1871 family protein [Psychrobacillus sp. AK 1817]QGM29433.1 DUF1871 family protein [Bacillus sp. N3536]
MDTIEMNRKAVWLLQEWDPFKFGIDAYETEIADVVASLHDIDHPSELARKIQEVYEHSFEQWIPLEKCVEISYKLIALKYEMKCII